MKTIAFISGKGGTGKTSVVASFAQLAAPVVVADCDVDAANAAILMPGDLLRSERFVSGRRAEIDAGRCVGCGLCAEACRFNAISWSGGVFTIDSMACEGCAVCQLVCDFDAVELSPNEAGALQLLSTKEGMLVKGELYPAQSNSGKLVTRVREIANDLAEESGIELVMLDGPPGVGCPVHATLARADLVVIVTEPTPSGEHDMERALELIAHFGLEGVTIINKADLSEELADRLERRSVARGVPVIGRLPFLVEVPRALARRQSLLEVEPLSAQLDVLWKKIAAILRDREQLAATA